MLSLHHPCLNVSPLSGKYREWADRFIVATVAGVLMVDLDGRPHPHFQLPSVPAYLAAPPVLSTSTTTWAQAAW
jgi:hypothetical protein